MAGTDKYVIVLISHPRGCSEVVIASKLLA